MTIGHIVPATEAGGEFADNLVPTYEVVTVPAPTTPASYGTGTRSLTTWRSPKG